MHERDTPKYGIQINYMHIKTDSNALYGPSWGSGRGVTQRGSMGPAGLTPPPRKGFQRGGGWGGQDRFCWHSKHPDLSLWVYKAAI